MFSSFSISKSEKGFNRGQVEGEGRGGFPLPVELVQVVEDGPLGRSGLSPVGAKEKEFPHSFLIGVDSPLRFLLSPESPEIVGIEFPEVPGRGGERGRGRD